MTISIPGLYKDPLIRSYLYPEEMEAVMYVKKESDISRNKGDLAPIILDKIVFGLAIRLHDGGKKVIMDGCPRGVSQAQLFMNMLGEERRSHYKIIELCFLDNPEGKSRERQLYRAQNSDLSTEEKQKKIAKIPRKIQVYLENTLHGVKLMEELGVPKLVLDAEQPIYSIHEQIKKYIKI